MIPSLQMFQAEKIDDLQTSVEEWINIIEPQGLNIKWTELTSLYDAAVMKPVITMALWYTTDIEKKQMPDTAVAQFFKNDVGQHTYRKIRLCWDAHQLCWLFQSYDELNKRTTMMALDNYEFMQYLDYLPAETLAKLEKKKWEMRDGVDSEEFREIMGGPFKKASKLLK